MQNLFKATLLWASFLTLFVLQVNADNGGAAVDLTIENMSYICGCKPDKANPAGDDHLVYQGNYCGAEEIFLVDIDLSNIPLDKEIKTAELKLFCFDSTGSGKLTYEPIMEPWDQQVTYNRKPKSNPEYRVTCETPVKDNWLTVDITTIVKAWQSGAVENYGLICSSIEGKDGTFSVSFPSCKTEYSGFAPKVTVYFK